MTRRRSNCTSSAGLAAVLALVLLAAERAESSLPRSSAVWESNPPGALTVTSHASADIVSGAAVIAATLDAGERESFTLGEVSLSGSAYEDRFQLGSAALIDAEPLRGSPSSYPETRIKVFEFLGENFIGVERGVSLELRPACTRFSLGLAEDEGLNLYLFAGGMPHEKTDPLGLFTPTPDTAWDLASLGIDLGFAVYDIAKTGHVSAATTAALGVDALAFVTPVLPGGGAAGLIAHAGAGAMKSARTAKQVEQAARALKAGTKAAQIASKVPLVGNAMMSSHSNGTGSATSNGVGSTQGSGSTGKPGWTAEKAKTWLKGLKTKGTPQSTPQGAFEVTHTGPENKLVESSKASFWTDGIELVESRGTIQEAKMVVSPKSSPFIHGAQGRSVRQFIIDDVRNEFRRMGEIVRAPDNPITSVEVITNSAEARPFFEGLLKEFEIPGEVIVKPPTP